MIEAHSPLISCDVCTHGILCVCVVLLVLLVLPCLASPTDRPLMTELRDLLFAAGLASSFRTMDNWDALPPPVSSSSSSPSSSSSSLSRLLLCCNRASRMPGVEYVLLLLTGEEGRRGGRVVLQVMATYNPHSFVAECCCVSEKERLSVVVYCVGMLVLQSLS